MDLYYCDRVVKIETMSPVHFSVCLVFRANDLSTYLPYINTFRLPGSCHSFYEQVSLDAILEWGQSLPQRLSVKRVHSVKSSQNFLNDAIIQPSSTELRNVVVLSCSCQSGVWLAQSTQPFLYLRATRHMQTVI